VYTFPTEICFHGCNRRAIVRRSHRRDFANAVSALSIDAGGFARSLEQGPDNLLSKRLAFLARDDRKLSDRACGDDLRKLWQYRNRYSRVGFLRVYRSVHLIYRFVGKATSSPWNRLWIEIQLRTSLQHSWATAVETVDAFTSENLKFGAGSDDWKRFFQLVSALHARAEKTAPIPNVPTAYEALAREAKLLERKLGVIHRLEQYAHITQQITRKKRGINFDWYVLQILPDAGRVIVKGFPLDAFDSAKDSLVSLEAKFKGTRNQAVLVATASLNELRRAYPNYFADTKFFIEVLRSLVR
jgi:hypothetical protein